MYIPFNFISTEGSLDATGGNVQTFSSGGINYKSHEWNLGEQNATHSFTVNSGITNQAQILVVGAGGGYGGGDFSDPDYFPPGGGGGEAIISSSLRLVGGTSYEIILGSMGTDSYGTGPGTNGGNASINGPSISETALGGGGGGGVIFGSRDGLSGGSGGGAGTTGGGAGSNGSAGAGARGGDGGSATTCPPNFRGGAGGGATGNASGNDPGPGLSTTMRIGVIEYYAHGGVPGIASIPYCSADTFPPGFFTARAGHGNSYAGIETSFSTACVIITYPI